MEKPITPVQKWSAADGETILRIETIDKKRRDKFTREPQWRRLFRVAVLGLIGLVIVYLGALRSLEEGIGMPALFGCMIGVYMLFLAVRSFRQGPSFFESMDRYVFTDKRIALLDSNDRIIDEIGSDLLGDVTRDKRYEVTIHWAIDSSRDRIFPIFHLNDFNKTYEFIVANYHILSHDPEGWPRNEDIPSNPQGFSP
jgi:hypothetical protein